jgi:NADPH:quinone reductase-like Zn-dependent oxidoreductase
VKAAVLAELGAAPGVGELDRPEPQAGQQLIEVEAAGLNPVDVNVSRGLQFPPPLPYVVGMEGIGRTADGRRVYFDAAMQPFGSFAEYCIVAGEDLMDVPDGVDSAAAMPFGIAGLAAWTGFRARGSLNEGDSVLVLGASSIVGQIAVQIARRLGAGRVVAAARDAAQLDRLAGLGADATVRLRADRTQLVAELQDAAAGGFDFVLDLLWGEPLVAAIEAMAEYGRVVQIGGSASPTADLPARSIRNRGIAIVGHTIYHAPVSDRAEGFATMCGMSVSGELVAPVEEVALEDVAEAWERQQGGPHVKLVIRPGGLSER